jgi:hypothetical protein
MEATWKRTVSIFRAEDYTKATSTIIRGLFNHTSSSSGYAVLDYWMMNKEF